MVRLPGLPERGRVNYTPETQGRGLGYEVPRKGGEQWAMLISLGRGKGCSDESKRQGRGSRRCWRLRCGQSSWRIKGLPR